MIWERRGDVGYHALTAEKINCLIGEIIDRQPVVDAEPVKHGTWIAIEEQSAICSRCKSPLKSNGKDMTGNALIHKAVYHYCPNCGAKMDRGISDGIDE